MFSKEKYPFGLQKLETEGFRFFHMEVIYTEKMITLRNVIQSDAQRRLEILRSGAEFWLKSFGTKGQIKEGASLWQLLTLFHGGGGVHLPTSRVRRGGGIQISLSLSLRIWRQ